MNVIVIVLYAVSAGLLLIGIVLWTRTESFLRHAVPTTGTIIRIEKSTNNSGGDYTVYDSPVFRYETNVGERVKVSPVGTSSSAYRVGQQVRVLYDPADPASARINTWFQVWGGPVILFIVGIGFAIGALIFTFVPHH